MTEDRLLEISIVARRLGVTSETVRRWIRTGKLAGEKLPGGHWRVRASNLPSMRQTTSNHTISQQSAR